VSLSPLGSGAAPDAARPTTTAEIAAMQAASIASRTMGRRTMTFSVVPLGWRFGGHPSPLQPYRILQDDGGRPTAGIPLVVLKTL